MQWRRLCAITADSGCFRLYSSYSLFSCTKSCYFFCLSSDSSPASLSVSLSIVDYNRRPYKTPMERLNVHTYFVYVVWRLEIGVVITLPRAAMPSLSFTFWGGISTSSFLSIAKIFRFLPFYFVDFAQAFENVKRARQ